MPDVSVNMPIAVLPEGADPATFYGRFTGKVNASWTPATDLVVWLDASPDIARLHAPLKAAVRFVPTGSDLDGAPATTDMLLLQTWPTDYIQLKQQFTVAVPSIIRMENVDSAAVRASVQPIFTALGRGENAVNDFMAGQGLCKVDAGMPIGAAKDGVNPPGPATPNRVTIRLFDGVGEPTNPIQFFSEAAGIAGIDKTRHPLLTQLELTGWIEIAIADIAGSPLAGEPFVLYFANGTTRMGTTDGDGRIFETDVPAGPWGVDIVAHPSFEIISENG